MSLIWPITDPIWPIAATAPLVSDWMLSIFRLMSSVALAVSLASSFTSFATTAKPFPASPARAASMVAFSASRFVCCAIEVITLITWPISALLWPSLVIVRLVASAERTAAFATFRHHVGLVRCMPGTEADLLRATAQLRRRKRPRLAHVRHPHHGRAKHL